MFFLGGFKNNRPPSEMGDLSGEGLLFTTRSLTILSNYFSSTIISKPYLSLALLVTASINILASEFFTSKPS